MYLIIAKQTQSITTENKTIGHNLSSSHTTLGMREISPNYVLICSWCLYLIFPLDIQICRHNLDQEESTLNYSTDMLCESADE